MNSKVSARLLTVLAGCLLLTFLIGAPVQAQIETGRIQGSVKDQSGAVIPDALVTLTNVGTNLSLRVTTGPTGYYMFPGLLIGNYRIEVEAKGFAQYVQTGVTLHVQEDAVVDVTLVPGTVTQRVEVRAEAPVLQTQNSALGTTVESKLANDLPLMFRNWLQLAQLGEGVTYSQNSTTDFSADGHPLEQNIYAMNGLSNNNDGWHGTIVMPPPDAIAEFKVQTGSYSAEFGKGGGAVVNATTKSGTNKVRGDLWEYARNDAFDAANFFENSGGIPKGPYRQNYFGATVGGPVYFPHIYDGRNKTFFFADYQGWRIRQATTTIDTVPTASMANSNFTDMQDLITSSSGTRTDNLGRTFPLGTMFDPATTRTVTAGQTDPVTNITAPQSGFVRDPFYQGSLAGLTNFVSPAIEGKLNLLPAGRLDPNAIKLLQLYPTPNGPGFYSNYTYGGPLKSNTDQYDFRLDHNFSAKDQMFFYGDGEYDRNFTPQAFPGLAGDAQQWAVGTQPDWEDAFGVSETHFFSPTMINQIGLVWLWSLSTYGGSYPNVMGIPEKFGIQGIPQVAGNGGLPAIDLAGLTPMGTAGWLPTSSGDWAYDLTENFTKVYGAHTFKGGFQGDYIRYPEFQPAWSHGGFDFGGAYTEVPNTSGGAGGMAQLLLSPTVSSVPGGFANVGGSDTVYASNLAPTNDERYYFASYFQDDWKMTPKLTVNLGLRWDHTEPYTDRFGAQGNFVPGAPGSGAEYLLFKPRCNSASPKGRPPGSAGEAAEV